MHDDLQPHPPPATAETTLAPWPHTVAIIAMFTAWCIIGGHRAHTVAEGPHLVTYLSSIMMGWMALGTVVAGLYHRRRFFFDTLRRNASRWYIDAGLGILIYFGALALFILVHSVLRFTPLTKSFDTTVLLAMAPQNAREMLMWIGVSFTAGFCEEHLFRGYLLAQVCSWGRTLGASRSFANAFSVLTTSALFGALHLYQGAGGAIMIGLLGVFYAVLALRLGNLRAVIVAHFLQDFVTAAIVLSRHTHSS